ncbi:interferon-induced protein 44-like [Cololabis saira]|uniref:interferon-induced protein 44-like n=1 Tax=Cololabis saira TaxID=129043 RepID=UPI002AD4FDEB|nr:interferon-induced protein 44-like [Cololabis saira]
MGGGSSTPPRTPPPSPLLRGPWRQISWGDNEKDLKYVKDYQPQNDEISHLRILLYGPVGAGKSSLINSVHSVVRERPAIPASASGTSSDKSHTKMYETHKIQKEGRGNFYPFVFNDFMGLEEGAENGVNTYDIKLALKGRVKEGYKFNPLSPLSYDDPGYNSSPSPDDRVHVLVCVYSANASEVRSSVLEKMKVIREAATELGIPQLAVLTHIDKACGETEESLRNVYNSKYLKKKMSDFSSKLGIPMNCILPVKNYSDEIVLDEDVNTLILNALKLMIDFGDDFINKL